MKTEGITKPVARELICNHLKLSISLIYKSGVDYI